MLGRISIDEAYKTAKLDSIARCQTTAVIDRGHSIQVLGGEIRICHRWMLA